MTSAFYIAHATAGRTRIRWAGDVSDKASIVEVAENISDIQGVDQAMPRIKTGSIIIEHEQTDWSTLEPLLTDKLSLEFTTPVARARTGIDVLNQGYYSGTQGPGDRKLYVIHLVRPQYSRYESRHTA